MFRAGRGTIGLDIGSSYIKIIQLKDVKGGYQLELFDMQPLSPEIIVDGSVIDSFRLIDSLKELVRKTKIRTKNTVIGMAGHSSVIIKRISLPEMSEEELSESIKFEAEQYVPFNIEDVNLDFQIIGPKDEPGQMDVILVAVKKDIINEYVSCGKSLATIDPQPASRREYSNALYFTSGPIPRGLPRIRHTGESPAPHGVQGESRYPLLRQTGCRIKSGMTKGLNL